MLPFSSMIYFMVPTVIALIGIRKYIESKWVNCRNTVKLQGKVAIVTGANSGIGYEIARELTKRGAKVILACRNVSAGNRTIARIERELNKKTDQICIELDLASIKSIKRFASIVLDAYTEIHILFNNAGVSYPDGKKHFTSDGFEMQMGVNHLGHYLLTNLLLDTLQATPNSRIVVVSSKLHEKGDLNLDDLNYNSVARVKKGYANSKLANVYFCMELSKRLQGNCKVYAMCPGWVLTNLFRHNIGRMLLFFPFVIPAAFLFMRSPYQGAQTAIYCATEPSLEHESGCLYRNCGKYNSKLQFDENISKNLWKISEQLIKEAELKQLSSYSPI